ncbi:MAG: SMC-Scp complex subunit ScpB, partial [Longimicrobiales bacterium]
ISERQPLGRAEIEDIRGVGSSGVLRTLQDRSLVEPVARGEGLGRPLLYGTTQKFLEHFGFRSLEDLPRPDELPVVLRDRTPVTALPLDEDPASAAAADVPDAADAPAGGESTAALSDRDDGRDAEAGLADDAGSRAPGPADAGDERSAGRDPLGSAAASPDEDAVFDADLDPDTMPAPDPDLDEVSPHR